MTIKEFYAKRDALIANADTFDIHTTPDYAGFSV